MIPQSIPKLLIDKKIEECLQKRNAILQEYILEYLTRTGCPIEELTLVEEIRGNVVMHYLAKKSDIRQ